MTMRCDVDFPFISKNRTSVEKTTFSLFSYDFNHPPHDDKNQNGENAGVDEIDEAFWQVENGNLSAVDDVVRNVLVLTNPVRPDEAVAHIVWTQLTLDFVRDQIGCAVEARLPPTIVVDWSVLFHLQVFWIQRPQNASAIGRAVIYAVIRQCQILFL